MTMWPVAGGLDVLAESCEDCGSRFAAALDEAGGSELTVLTQPDLSADAKEWSVAIHEAGHAAIAAVTGRQVLSAEAYPWDSAPADYVGRVIVADELNASTALGYVAGNLAGQEAAVKWLAESGRDTPATILGARYGSHADNARAAEISRRYGVSVESGLAVCREILDDRWPQVRILAGDLLSQTYLDGPEVHRVFDARTDDDTDTY